MGSLPGDFAVKKSNGVRFVQKVILCFANDLVSIDEPHVVDPSALLPYGPSELHPDLAKELGMPYSPQVVESEGSVQYAPAMGMPKNFHWVDVNKQSAVSVTSQQIVQWKQNPEPLQRIHGFIGEVDGVEEAFKVKGLLTMEKDRVHYVQFVGDDEAIAFSNDEFFEMLKGAKQVMSRIGPL